MKPSLFNFMYSRSDGAVVVYNTFSKAVVVFDDLENLNASYSSNSLKEQKILTEQGLLVPDEYDELAILKYFHYKAKFSGEHLILTVAPTMQCNFSCPYCYENPRSGKMSDEVQNALVSFVEGHISNGVKDIDLTWYGGEPLLYPDIIESVSSRICALAKENNVKLGLSMVTNGSLITREIVTMLERNKILSIQVTLDGMAENHDKRRPYRSGKGSHDDIMRNLAFFAGTPVRVVIRMNTDRQNMSDYPLLKEQIDAMAKDMKISVYPALVEHLQQSDAREGIYLSSREYEDFISRCHADASIEHDELSTISNRRYYCTAELNNCYVVDELGNMYKCWDEIGQRARICSNVATPDIMNYQAITRYLCDDPFQADSECSRCQFLPLCFGGCRYQSHYFSKSKCTISPGWLQDYIEAKYFQGAHE